MARIRILQAIGGLDFSWAPGELVDVPDDEASVWADGDRAELVDDAEPHQEQAPSVVHRQPKVVGEDGQELEVLAATVDEIAPSADAAEGSTWVQWSVTVRLPLPERHDDGAPPEPGHGGDPFDPIAHPVKDVLAYLQDVGEEEAMRVLQLESEGEDRRGIAREREAIVARARANDQARAEKTAEASRGGGRGDGIETR